MSHCKAVDQLETKCDQMLVQDYTRGKQRSFSSYLSLCNKYDLKNSKKLRSHSVQEVAVNENVEIGVDILIKTDVKIQHNRPYLFV